jgi:hypothetical protein
MKALETYARNTPFAGILDLIAETLGRPNPKGAEQGWLARTASRLWRRQVRGVDAYLSRADSMFAALDRWLWKQRMRETEAWLAQSKDVFELEARIRELERAPQSRIF